MRIIRWVWWILLLPLSVLAQGNALDRNPRLEWEGPMDYAATGATLMRCMPDAGGGLVPTENCQPLEEGTAVLDVLPDDPGLRIVYAQLTWFATLPQPDGPDLTATLIAPGGQPVAIDADMDKSEQFNDSADQGTCLVIRQLSGFPDANCDLTFYSAHSDVTEALRAHQAGGGSLNGEWTVRDVDVPGASIGDPRTAAAAVGSLAIGGWTLFVVYELENLPLRRIYYYQGFELNGGMNRVVEAQGFRAPPDPRVDATFLVLEGDESIQGDSLRINGVEVSDGCNPNRNVFNSTVNTGRADGQCIRNVASVDLDRFRLDDLLEPGDTEASVEFVIPRGDGVFTAGEQIFTNWLILAFDHQPASFTTLKPEKTANPPSNSVVPQGGEIEYLIVVENTGGDFADNVVVTDAIPEGTTYVLGSTSVDQRPVADVGLGSDPVNMRAPTVRGLNLNSLPGIDLIAPRDRHTVIFRVRITGEPETEIHNIATIAADELEPADSDLVLHIVGEPLNDFGVQPDMTQSDAAVNLDWAPGPFPDRGMDPDMGCPRGETFNIRGMCVPIDCPDGSVLDDAGLCGSPRNPNGPCGPGTTLVDGLCQSICGAGLQWDPTCEGGGACRHGNNLCTNPRKDDGCGCRVDTGHSGEAIFALLCLIALRRRRHS